MRYVITITTLKDPISFFAKGQTREEARQEALEYIWAWPLNAPNQPCSYRVTESHWLFAEQPQPKGETS